MTPSSAKAKGRKLQGKVRDKLLEVFPQLEPDDVRSTSMGAGGEDLQLSPAARRVFPFGVECKSHKSFAVYGILDQAASHGPHEPLAVLQANRRKPVVVVDLDVFLDLVAKTLK